MEHSLQEQPEAGGHRDSRRVKQDILNAFCSSSLQPLPCQELLSVLSSLCNRVLPQQTKAFQVCCGSQDSSGHLDHDPGNGAAGTMTQLLHMLAAGIPDTSFWEMGPESRCGEGEGSPLTASLTDSALSLGWALLAQLCSLCIFPALFSLHLHHREDGVRGPRGVRRGNRAEHPGPPSPTSLLSLKFPHLSWYPSRAQRAASVRSCLHPASPFWPGSWPEYIFTFYDSQRFLNLMGSFFSYFLLIT